MHTHVVHLGRLGYGEGLAVQARVVAARKAGEIGDTLLLLEHPPVITLGRNAWREHVVATDEFLASRGVELHEVNRGGDVTYHGPGQLVGYPIFDLRGEWPGKKGPFLGPVDFVRMLEEALIRVCGDFGVMAKRIPKCTGVWTFGGGESVDPVHDAERLRHEWGTRSSEGDSPGGPTLRGEATRNGARGDSEAAAGWELQDPTHDAERVRHEGGTRESQEACAVAGVERKLAAIGVHVSQGVTSHGFALNVTTDLREFEWIVPCGITDRGVTSLELEAATGVAVTMEAVVNSTSRHVGRVFGRQMLWVESLDQLLGAATAG